MTSIRSKIILIIISCTLLLGGVIASFSIIRGSDLLEKQATALIISNTDNIFNKIESENKKIESIISTVAVMMVDNFQLETALLNQEYLEERTSHLSSLTSEILKRSNTKNGGVVSIYATFNVSIFKEVFETWHTVQNGDVILMEDEPLSLFDDPNNPDMAWYNEPIRKKRGLWTAPYEDAITKVPMYSYVEPAIDNNGNVIGIVGMDVSLAGISKFVSENKTMEKGFSFLIDQNNEFIVEPREKINDNLMDSLLVSAKNNSQGIVSNQKAIMAFKQLPNKQIVVTYASRADILAENNALKMNLIFFTLLMALISAVLGFLLIAPIISRLDRLKKATELTDEEDISAAVSKIDSKDEIGQLAEAFIRMLKKIKNARLEIDNNNRDLEKKVLERTQEIQKKIAEVEKINKLMVGREMKMIELKKQLAKQSNETKD